MNFDPQDPFPLVSADVSGSLLSYAEAQAHSALVDEWLGLHTESTEANLIASSNAGNESFNGQQLWIGLPVRSLLTPYTEIREILAKLAPESGSMVVDLGAGYGRMGFVIGRHYPDVHFVGYEYVPSRVEQANRSLQRWGYPHVRNEVADLSSSDFMPISAQYYFLYDYGSRAAITKTLEDLKQIARSQRVTIVGRGRASRDAIERDHPWLSQVNAPAHFHHYSIYRS